MKSISTSLINALKTETQGARHAFWKTHFGDIYAIALHVLKDPPLANDVTTDVLVDFMFTHVHSLTNPNSAKSYLRLMTIRRAINAKNKRFKETLIENMDDYLDDTHQETTVNQCLFGQIMGHYISKLTPKAQSILRLKYEQDLPNEQIGKLVGGSKQYIGKVLNNSILKLRESVQFSYPY